MSQLRTTIQLNRCDIGRSLYDNEQATLATFGGTKYGGAVAPAGSNPRGTLLIDAAGNLYATIVDGGIPSPNNPNYYGGNGVIFKLAADHRTLTVLYRSTGGADGLNRIPA